MYDCSCSFYFIFLHPSPSTTPSFIVGGFDYSPGWQKKIKINDGGGKKIQKLQLPFFLVILCFKIAFFFCGGNSFSSGYLCRKHTL